MIGTDGERERAVPGEELGWRAFLEALPVEIVADTDCGLITIEAREYIELLRSIPQLNYQTRKRLLLEADSPVSWQLGEVSIY